MSIDVASHGIHPVAAALHGIPARQQIDDRLEELPGEPLSGGDGETHLVCTLADVLGYATGHCFTKHELVPGPAHLPVVRQRKSELREAITNLILNAVDALPDGGALSVRSGVRGWDQSGEARRQSTHVFSEVCDTGVGMDEPTRKRCLEPFFSTKGQRGTGLGLAMVYGIVERHEGNIEIESEPGKGTTMRLVFPIGEAHPAADAAPDSVTTGPSLKVLCIDDEPLLREMLQQILEHGGHRAVVADSGKGALELFRVARESGEPFDAVITDLGMPYLDGRQVAKALKHESSTTPWVLPENRA